MNSSAVFIEAEMRDAERHRVRLHAEMRCPGTVRIPGVISDISRSGFRFDTGIDMPSGTRVNLGVHGMKGFDAVVIRQVDGHCGCAFLTPLDEPVLSALTSALD
ncbi:PilZ domain-containing protein [Pacificimonas sp. WHA3]|uniref:PilZ domain-containing protein n=1 Tax=Pacificimonas pallii TaxID=2827236 RepID=A0ABS6SB83_9SPHN|nr:PilZ domain-containing protein [Pacificimonas pallii]MBV7255480.1 PilZ domain-containing protein [Pacificimonas pallii]